MYNMPMQLAQFIVMILMITQYNEYKVANTWCQCHCTATSMGDIEYLVPIYIHRYKNVNTWYLINNIQLANADGTTHSNDTYDNSI